MHDDLEPPLGPQQGDAYGQLLQSYHETGEGLELIERDDGFLDSPIDAGLYFLDADEWPTRIRDALDHVHGRVLDIGCGAGQHALYCQAHGHETVGIDISPGAVAVSTDRGLERVEQRGIDDLDTLAANSFDTVLLLGNNLGLLENAERAPHHLEALKRVVRDDGTIIAESRDPTATDFQPHLDYHELNRERGVLPGRLVIRARYRRIATNWFEYLMVDENDLARILAPTAWGIETTYEQPDGPQYVAILSLA